MILGGGEDSGTAGHRARWPDHPPTDPTEESKGDKGDLVDRAAAGYRYVSDRAGLGSARGPKLLGLFANEEMFEHREEGDGDLYDPSVPLPRWRPRRSTSSPRTATAVRADRGRGDRRDGAREQHAG